MSDERRIKELVRRRERRLQKIGDKLADRKFLSPSDGDFLLDEIERLELVVQRQHQELEELRG